VRISAKTAAVVTVALMAAVTLASCGLRAGAGAQAPAGASVAATAAASAATVTPDPAAAAAGTASGSTSKPGLSSSDVQSLNQELDAMQKELDGLNMPSDSDYNGAASAVY